MDCAWCCIGHTSFVSEVEAVETVETVFHNFISPHAPFTIHTLLYGHADINYNLNNTIYLQTINYIESTKRFSL